PYFVYSVACIALVWKAGRYYQTLTDVFPALLGALLAPFLIGLLAKFVGVWMRNQGCLEADLERAVVTGDDVLAESTPRMQPTGAVGPESDTPHTLKHVTFA